ncbi:AAA family ATPase [Acuticoccus sp. M5D2P5]|uniref:bifunctional aminoglycoside phosphotransferase/ATP-binding protein n=1 Tax=Acuticoccus kalidii TaxID=2910977 RepID=UPI001F2EAB23|nr:bifunctional aminoglycoside phosphotransferase/ATP-binding protein [Acuticoccus kalidii]MCF3932217.1 AAA family ATPase [Acuticoccus kalidii]
MPDTNATDTNAVDASERTQAAVVAYLSTLSDTAPITTHLSRVFLLPDRVLKLKRARTLPFVDYEALATREHFCRHEVEVNRRFAPALYSAARPVTREGDRLSLDGPGEVVDWVVDMKRFDGDSQFDTMVERGTLDGDMVDALAVRIAALHREAPVARLTDQAERVAELCRQLHDDLAPQLASEADRAALGRWRAAAETALARQRDELGRRARHGFVRRCHADLHLSNICLWQGEPTPFDAIEFDEDMATIDVLYDVAFVLIDLAHRGRRDLSMRLLSRYLEATRDYRGLAVLPLFMANRLMVRALVGAIKGRDPRPYLDEALAAIARPPAPHLVAIGGRSGTGKTTIARALAPTLNAVVIRTDAVRKELTDAGVGAHLPASAYVLAQRAAVYRRMLVDARRAIRAGWPVILDGTFLEPEWREAVGEAAAAWGVAFSGIWLEAGTETLAARVTARTNDLSDADAAVVRAQADAEIGPMRWSRVDASGSAERVAMRAEAALGETG